MENKKIYTIAIVLESISIPIFFGIAGTGLISVSIVKFILAIFFLITVFIIIKQLNQKKQKIRNYVFFGIVIIWNLILIIPYLILDSKLCLNCP